MQTLTQSYPLEIRERSRLMRARARTFYLASLFLPPKVRVDVQTVYAFYRTADDIVDEPPPGWARDDIENQLLHWREMLLGTTPATGPIVPAVLEVAERYRISHCHLAMIVDGVRFDLDAPRIETMDELRTYAVLVAGSVGMVLAPILGAREEAALAAACDLGVAMQLTNVLRDIGEDMGRGRCYLPWDEMVAAGYTIGELRAGVYNPAFCAVVARLVSQARELYERGLAGIPYLDPSARFGIYLAARLYARILDEIERSAFDVFARRVHLTAWAKWGSVPLCYAAYRSRMGWAGRISERSALAQEQ